MEEVPKVESYTEICILHLSHFHGEEKGCERESYHQPTPDSYCLKIWSVYALSVLVLATVRMRFLVKVFDCLMHFYSSEIHT